MLRSSNHSLTLPPSRWSSSLLPALALSSSTWPYADVTRLSGAYNGWRGVNAPESLVTSAYGQVLLLKFALVLIAAALGGHNRFFEMPQLLASLREGHTEGIARRLKRFATVLHVESVVLAGVLVAAAVLVSSPLPGTM